MTSPRPAGKFGIDAPWVPWLLTGLGVLYVGFTVMTLLPPPGPVWLAVLCAVLMVGFFAAAALYWHATLRGKFLVWRELLDAEPAPRRMLDLGCGHAAVSILAAQRWPQARVDGVDLWRGVDQSGNSVEAATANAQLNGVADRLQFTTADMTGLPFPDATFDLVTASLAIHNIKTAEGRATAVDEAWRVLVPGGRLLVLDISRTGEYEQRLRELGAVDVVRRNAGWRVWWGGPWMASRTLRAGKPG